jgi:hypothetical protein
MLEPEQVNFEQGRHRASEGSHGLGYSYHDTRRAPREHLSGSGCIFRILRPVYDTRLGISYLFVQAVLASSVGVVGTSHTKRLNVLGN